MISGTVATKLITSVFFLFLISSCSLNEDHRVVEKLHNLYFLKKRYILDQNIEFQHRDKKYYEHRDIVLHIDSIVINDLNETSIFDIYSDIKKMNFNYTPESASNNNLHSKYLYIIDILDSLINNQNESIKLNIDKKFINLTGYKCNKNNIINISMHENYVIYDSLIIRSIKNPRNEIIEDFTIKRNTYGSSIEFESSLTGYYRINGSILTFDQVGNKNEQFFKKDIYQMGYSRK